MNFEDLREYVIGDNIKDIDWKASARNRNLLIKQYIAEKKHNILLVLDTGKKMLADTEKGESKLENSIMSAGVFAYLANQNGDYVGAIYNKGEKIKYHPFKSTLYNIEQILTSYERDIQSIESSNLEKTLEYIDKAVKKRMIIAVVTDIEGIDNVKPSVLKKLSILNDVFFINISDAYMSDGNMAYDIDDNFYVPKMVFQDKKMHELEKKARKELYKKCVRKLTKNKISMVTINSNDEVAMKIIELLERHKNANNH